MNEPRKLLVIKVSDEERALIKKGASIRRRTVSDYLRWLVFVDYDAQYRLTDEGRKALEPEPQD